MIFGLLILIFFNVHFRPPQTSTILPPPRRRLAFRYALCLTAAFIRYPFRPFYGSKGFHLLIIAETTHGETVALTVVAPEHVRVVVVEDQIVSRGRIVGRSTPKVGGVAEVVV